MSEIGQNLHSTFCGDCYHGIVSAGSASGHGSEERKLLIQQMDPSRTLSDTWSGSDPVTSSLVHDSPDSLKHDSVRKVVTWFKEAHQIVIEDTNVHFFDDRASNVQSFEGSGFNALQVSCASRDRNIDYGAVGLCGGTHAEVVRKSGVHICVPISDVMV